MHTIMYAYCPQNKVHNELLNKIDKINNLGGNKSTLCLGCSPQGRL